MISQFFIFACSVLSIYFVTSKKPLLGFWIGLAGQPFWLWSSFWAGQWGVFYFLFGLLFVILKELLKNHKNMWW